VPADIAVRRADPVEADLVGELTERVYRDGGFGSGAYAEVLRDGRSRVRDGTASPSNQPAPGKRGSTDPVPHDREGFLVFPGLVRK
jgi:hypothetical protein